MWYLRLRGLRLIERNYATRLGEIDLIMRDRKLLVFVEVRYRSHATFGSPAATVTTAKQQRLVRTAKAFCYRHKKYRNFACRFDVISITKPNYRPQIDWIRDAFQL